MVSHDSTNLLCELRHTLENLVIMALGAKPPAKLASAQLAQSHGMASPAWLSREGRCGPTHLSEVLLTQLRRPSKVTAAALFASRELLPQCEML
jgi:hypothetical protein